MQHPDRVWVTDITYVRTHEGWLYLTIVIDLYSRAVVGWSMNSAIATELVLNLLLIPWVGLLGSINSRLATLEATQAYHGARLQKLDGIAT